MINVGTIFKLLSRFLFWASVLFLVVFLWVFTTGQTINYEFKNIQLRNECYDILFSWTPVVVLLTLFGTFKRTHTSARKFITILFTVVLSLSCFWYLFTSMFAVGFGVWSTLNIAYENRLQPEHQIREQQYDIGALGYGGNRIVEVKPFGGLFWKVTPVDTSHLDKTKWVRVDKEGDVKFP